MLRSAILLLLFLSTACHPKVSSEGGDLAAALPTPTPFQPRAGLVEPVFDWSPLPSPTPAPTSTPGITIEGGQYPTPPAALATSFALSPYSPPPGINPLTGLPPADPALLARRPMAIKVTNYPRYVRPQSGLTRADVVFEYYIEAGLTRFIAVFYGQDAERVGPVRSGRFFDEHVARMYQAYLVFKYADKRVFDYLKESDLADFLVVPGISACPPFRVGKQERDTYNNIFFDTTAFGECLERAGKDNSPPDLRNGYFYALPPFSWPPAERVYLRFSADDYSYWQYDSEQHHYVRYQETVSTRDGKTASYDLLTDALTGEPVTADNVVVLFVPYTFANQFDEEDEVYHVDLYDAGGAYVFREGVAIQAVWWRLNRDQPLVLTDPNGALIPLRPGNTFYEVIGESSAYWQEGNTWRFEFETP